MNLRKQEFKEQCKEYDEFKATRNLRNKEYKKI